MRLFLLFFLVCHLFAFAQIREEFEVQLKQDKDKVAFESQLRNLNGLLNEPELNLGVIEKLIASGNYTFMQIKERDSLKYLLFDLTQFLAIAYMKLEESGQINNLKLLRSKKLLSVPYRIIASDVQLPVKTNKKQSYGVFYLSYIKQFIREHSADLASVLTFNDYMAWEKEKNFKTEEAVVDFRSSFILFLLKRYS